jgi:hypothetical protein
MGKLQEQCARPRVVRLGSGTWTLVGEQGHSTCVAWKGCSILDIAWASPDAFKRISDEILRCPLPPSAATVYYADDTLVLDTLDGFN